MKISNIYMPGPSPHKAAEEVIVVLGAYPLLDEVRQIIFQTRVFVTPTKTSRGRAGARGASGNRGLAAALNRYLGYGLSHHGWTPHYPKGVINKKQKIDWFKVTPDKFVAQRTGGGVGVGVETQFGNNFQAHGDLERLQNAYNYGEIGAGIIIVPATDLAQYLSDRCASFGNTSNKLKLRIDTLIGARAFNLCPIGIIGVSHDGATGPDEPFRLESPWPPESGDLGREDEEVGGEEGED